MPTVLVSPFGPKPAFQLATGLPAVGNQIFFYVAGSVGTKQNTYTDSTGNSANTNPIILNTLGEPTNEIWFQQGLSYKVVYAPSTDTDPPTSPIWTIDNLYGTPTSIAAVDQWVAPGLTPTFVSGTSFTLVGDQTSAFHVGRRLKSTNSGGTIYSTITISAFGAVTTVTVVNDSGALDAGLSAVSYGLLTADNPSTPLLVDTYPIVSGSVDKTKKVRIEADGLTTATTRVVTVPDRNLTIGPVLTATSAVTAGSSVSITGIPSGTNHITATLNAISTNGVAVLLLQLGDSGGLENNAYVSGVFASGGGGEVPAAAGFNLNTASVAARSYTGVIDIYRHTGNTWMAMWRITNDDGSAGWVGTGSKTTSAELDRVGIVTTDTFDGAGTMSIQYE